MTEMFISPALMVKYLWLPSLALDVVLALFPTVSDPRYSNVDILRSGTEPECHQNCNRTGTVGTDQVANLRRLTASRVFHCHY